ncbi:MAG: LacI family transcriptional regulator [Clostridiales bacterium]|nr:LacI family transcriptional regulator [Clostridiales bacterium]
MAKANVKMADIAQALGVSTVAVSKALSGQKGVSEDLRERIKKTAEEMGYRSPKVLRQVKYKSGFNIGVLICERYVGTSEAFYWKLYQELTAQAMKRECFVLLELLSEQDMRQMHMPKLVTENKADGLIIIGKPAGRYATTLRNSWSRPVLYLDFYEDDLSADAVISNGFFGMYALTNYLWECGHRKIGYIGTLGATDSIADRYFGYCKSMMVHGLTVNPAWVLDDRDLQTGLDIPIAFPEDGPTAYVCNCDYEAGRAIRELNARGIRVPEDVSIVGFDDYMYPGLCDKGITTYSANVQEMTGIAMRMMIARLSGEPGRTGLQVTDGRLVIRDTVRVIETEE